MDKEQFIFINKEKVLVTEEVYREFKRPIWRERKRLERERENEETPLSLDALAEVGFDVPSGDMLLDEVIADKLLLEMLMDALEKLTDEERGLINALYYEDKSERETANETGRSKTSVHKQKIRIIEKLQKFFDLG